MEEEVAGPSSPAKNIVTGGGCGCGCLGTMAILAGGIGVAGVPLGFYNGSIESQAMIGAGGVLAMGLIMGLVGAVSYAAGVLFME